MSNFKVGDIVARKSHGSDVYFRISDVLNTNDGKQIYILKGLMYRIEADCFGDDLIKQNLMDVRYSMRKELMRAKRYSYSRSIPRGLFLMRMVRSRPGRILHIDSSSEFMDMCLKQYGEANIRAAGRLAAEKDQPLVVKRYLESYRPDILVLTGHDSLKKNADRFNLGSYRNSKYFVESVKVARKYQPDFDKLCIFAGACQSYFEVIMDAGANFASSPGRILINALDPAIVSEKVALTDYRETISPEEISRLTISGNEGIGGIRTKGHLNKF